MDYDDHVFKEAENYTEDKLNFTDESMQYLAEEIILLIFGLIGISANILLIYIICYYRKLHTSTNIYLVNWAIADIGAILVTISCFGMFSLLYDVPDIILCLYFGFACAIFFDVTVYMLVLAVDWCLSAFLPRPLEKFRKHTSTIVAAIWIFSIVYSLASTAMCSLSAYYLLFHYTVPFTFAVLFVFVIALHITRLVKKCKGSVEYHPVSLLFIPSFFVLCWFLSWTNLWVVDIPSALYMISETPIFLHPIVNLLLLIALDQDFRICFFQVVKCFSCKIFKVDVQNANDNDPNVQTTHSNKNVNNSNRNV